MANSGAVPDLRTLPIAADFAAVVANDRFDSAGFLNNCERVDDRAITAKKTDRLSATLRPSAAQLPE